MPDIRKCVHDIENIPGDGGVPGGPAGAGGPAALGIQISEYHGGGVSCACVMICVAIFCNGREQSKNMPTLFGVVVKSRLQRQSIFVLGFF